MLDGDVLPERPPLLRWIDADRFIRVESGSPDNFVVRLC